MEATRRIRRRRMVKTTATSATTYAAQRGVRGRKTLLKERVKLNDEKFGNGEGKKGLVLPVKTLKKYGEEEKYKVNIQRQILI